MDFSVITDLLLSIVPALICISLHELAHGFVAYKLGDDTAKNAGRLTLNPIKHIDIMGLAAMVFFRFGWAKPVPVNMNKFKDPKRGMALCALAGPMANLLISLLALFLYGLLFIPLGGAGQLGVSLLETLYFTAYLSLALCLFNLVPFPPLDGSKVLYSFLPEEGYRRLMHVERYGTIILFALLLIMNRSGINPIGAVTGAVYDKLFTVAQWGFDLTRLFL